MFRWKMTAAAVAASALAALPAMAQSTGFAEFIARINSNASISRGSGVASVTSEKTGVYVLTFSRDVFTCYPLVSVAGDSGFAITEFTPSARTQIKVSTFNKTGAATKRNFNILVRCQD